MPKSFEDILSMPIEDIKAPAAMPAGQYLAIIDGTGTEQAQDEPEKHRWVFRVKLLSALNVDHSELEEALNGRQLSAQSAPRFPKTIDCTVTAVPQSPGMLLILR